MIEGICRPRGHRTGTGPSPPRCCARHHNHHGPAQGTEQMQKTRLTGSSPHGKDNFQALGSISKAKHILPLATPATGGTQSPPVPLSICADRQGDGGGTFPFPPAMHYAPATCIFVLNTTRAPLLDAYSLGSATTRTPRWFLHVYMSHLPPVY